MRSISRLKHASSKIISSVLIAAFCFGLFPANAFAATIKTQAAADSLQNQGGIRGIDVSRWQGAIDWSKVAQDDVSFAFVRASYGAAEDPVFVTNVNGAADNGLKVGAYHYARFTNTKTMNTEADFFISQLKRVTLTYPVVLDIEQNSGKLSKSQLTGLVISFAERVRAEGYKVMIYSGENFLKGNLNYNALSDYDLWIANYLQQPVVTDHKIWQHTGSGGVRGIKGNVDVNIAYTDLSTKSSVRIPQNATDSAKVFLNTHYEADIDLNAKLDLAYIMEMITIGLQTEVNKQLGGSVDVDGSASDEEIELYTAMQFVKNETKGRITTLIQCRLMYTGLYLTPVNGIYDDNMVSAIASYQEIYGLTPTGEIDRDTWVLLLDV